MEGILLLVAAVAVILFAGWLWQKMLSAGASAVNRNVFQRDAHRTGTAIVEHPMTFTVAAPLAAVRASILATVRALDECPALVSSLYRDGESAELVNYSYGNKLRESFTSAVILSTADSGRSTEGVYVIREWTISGGVIQGVDVMKRVRAEIDSAIISLDPASVIGTGADA